MSKGKPIIEGLKLRDLGDRHVLAAAIRANAQVIVTSNLPTSRPKCWPHGASEAKSPDDSSLIKLTSMTASSGLACNRSQTHALSRRRLSMTFSTLWSAPASSKRLRPCAAERERQPIRRADKLTTEAIDRHATMTPRLASRIPPDDPQAQWHARSRPRHPGPMSWISAQVRAGALERQTTDLERVLGRPAETVISQARPIIRRRFSDDEGSDSV